jgi:hypothetical protein
MARWAPRLLRPTEWLVTASRFADTVSTVAIKTVDGVLHCPPGLSISRPCCHSALALMLLFCYCVWPSVILSMFAKVMARCSPLDEDMDGMMEVGNMDEAVVAAGLKHAFRENPAASDGERRPTSPDVEDILSEGGSRNENSWMYYFGSSTITICKIKEMTEKTYFPEDGAHAPRAEIVPEPDNNEAVVYEDFFVTGLCMPPHLALADILLHF